jgi:hypothetical protein
VPHDTNIVRHQLLIKELQRRPQDGEMASRQQSNLPLW